MVAASIHNFIYFIFVGRFNLASDVTQMLASLLHFHFFTAFVVVLVKHVLAYVHAVANDLLGYVFCQEVRDGATPDVVRRDVLRTL